MANYNDVFGNFTVPPAEATYSRLTLNDSGTLAYSFIDSLVAMHPYYIARAFGGLLFLSGAVVCSFNVGMTIRMARHARKAEAAGDVPLYGQAGAAQAGE